MSDERLRGLERSWRETGAAEDEAAFLRECLRMGNLDHQRLRIAAFCGHDASAQVMGKVSFAREREELAARCRVPLSRYGKPLPLPEPKTSDELSHSVACLSIASYEAGLRAEVAATHLVMRHWTGWEEGIFFNLASPPAQLALVERWLCSGDAVLREEARATVYEVSRPGLHQVHPGPWAMAHEAAEYVARAFYEAHISGEAAEFSVGAEEQAGGTEEEAVARIIEAIQYEVIPWILGYSDPVRERGEARRPGPAG